MYVHVACVHVIHSFVFSQNQNNNDHITSIIIKKILCE